ncbi:hypothetical protein [Georgenia sp. SYP-B2076]|uniref:hypothetical protein n=1 Tax=Georgenia sp. SYP-B2076 TaxID=2495881 RepID=UPI000F8CD266|nr:hypothetical protein [Georgenia sp. SYP-B2076]
MSATTPSGAPVAGLGLPASRELGTSLESFGTSLEAIGTSLETLGGADAGYCADGVCYVPVTGYGGAAAGPHLTAI